MFWANIAKVQAVYKLDLNPNISYLLLEDNSGLGSSTESVGKQAHLSHPHTHCKRIVGQHRSRLHASEAAAVGQALGDSEPVVVKIKETRLGLRLMELLLLLEKMAHLEAVRRLLGTAAVGIWYERQLAVEILLLLLLEWIHHVVAELLLLLLLLALEGIWIVVEDGGCGGQRIQLASTWGRGFSS